jgi:bifunctional non-homologous end joining protein LigD
MLPAPMLLRPGPIPTGTAWSFEVKWDGFRALVSTVDGLRVRSRRGWNMTPLLPELRSLPAGLVLDGELVAFDNGVPHFPHLTRRLLHGDRSIAVTFVAFDVLHADGHDLMRSPHHARPAVLESLALNEGHCMTPDTFDDGHALYQAVCEQGIEGVVAKRSASTYRPAQRGWIKIKNPGYWRREQELESLRRAVERPMAAV